MTLHQLFDYIVYNEKILNTNIGTQENGVESIVRTNI
jgi:hypothetical protein